MKKHISLLIINFITLAAFSQSYPILRTIPVSATHTDFYDIKSGDYIKDNQNQLNQYVGEWRYQDGNTIFILKLAKMSQVLNLSRNGDYTYRDELISTYKLVKNGVTLVDNLNLSQTNLNQNDLAFGSFTNSESFEYVNGIFTDLTNNIIVSRCEIKREVIAGIPQISFTLYSVHSWKRNPPAFYEGLSSIYSLPNNIQLEKIN